MKSYWFKNALLQQGWARDVRIGVDATGLIAKIESGTDAEGSETVSGIAIPGMVNVHSHAFQRAFAGLSEYRTSEGDSFWTWRKLMYGFLGKLGPEDCYAIARQLFIEMLQAGYTSVGEFHYVHNPSEGGRYESLSELADAVVRAAVDVGIAICMLPVLYQRGGFDGSAPNQAQRRFCLTTDELLEMVEQLKARWREHDNVCLGIAPHSLRAVDSEQIQQAVTGLNALMPGRPVHIHVAEQVAEVEACVAATGKRPVEYLLDRHDVDETWCLIHATHVSDGETRQLAESGAVAGLCPVTEANLGDGIFPAETFLKWKGRFAIGSDSHIGVDPRSELRTIEYAARLTTRRRAIYCDADESVGRKLYEAACRGGAQALGMETGEIAVGRRADLVVLDAEHINLVARSDDRWLDSYLFCESGPTPVKDTMVGGNWVIRQGQHPLQTESRRGYSEVLRRCL